MCETKRCSKCEHRLPLADFGVNPMGKLGRHSVCRACSRIADRRRYHADIEASRKREREKCAKRNAPKRLKRLTATAAVLGAWTPTPLPLLLPAAPTTTPCAHCGAGHDNRRRRYCSDACAAEAKLIVDRGHHPPGPYIVGNCPECGETVCSRGHNRFCCNEHADRYHRRAAKARRRAMKKGNGPTETIALPKLAMRDGWKCHLCGHRVDRDTWSIDHLVPLSLGGTHTWDNVALAHHICNSLRGVGGEVQLRLAA